jgi:uncharacterized protein (TIGR02452 family)
MSLVALAEEAVAIAERGDYALPSGRRVSIADAVARAVRGTRLYTPDDHAALERASVTAAAAPCRFEVTGETTAAAARRLVEEEGEVRVAALNFASGKNPGGGFLRGTKAQEEDLARCSALYACQITQRAYYDENRASGSALYTDHLIYAPDVPFFRDERLELLPAPFLVSILTSPAPKAGEALARDPGVGPAIRATLWRRSGQVLRVAAAEGHRTLVLGAWGCGVFKNDPEEVAEAFATWLGGPAFTGAFARVVFAVYDRSEGQENRRAFEMRFGAR